MTSRIIRWEKRKDSQGLDEVFIHVEVDDGEEVYSKAEWLVSSDVALVLADENYINTVATQVANRAVRERPTTVAHLEHERAMQIENARVETAKANAEAAKAQLEATQAQIELERIKSESASSYPSS